MSAMNRPMIRSLRPSPYTSAVSKNVTPDSAAARSTASASSSVTDPQSAPSCQVPRPTIETSLPVLPRTRCSMFSDPSRGKLRPMRYLVQERIFSLTTDFWIEDENGNRAFFVDGKALSLRETFELSDAAGNLRAVIRKKVFSFRDAMNIEDAGGVIATVRPALFSPFRHRYEIDLADGSRLGAGGKF